MFEFSLALKNIIVALIIAISVAIALIIIATIIYFSISLKYNNKDKESIWIDRKRTFLGLPLSFTIYELTAKRLLITTGLFTIKTEEIRLYRILDITYTANIFQRMFGIGDIVLNTTDKTSGKLTLKNVKNANKIKELLSDNIEIQRKENRVLGREIIEDDSCEEN